MTVASAASQVRAAVSMVPCPACQGLHFETLLSELQVSAEGEWLMDFYGRRMKGGAERLKDHASFTQSESTNVVCCKSCGTVYRNPQPTPEALATRYRRDHYGKRTLLQLLRSELDFYRAKAERCAALLPSGARVVEIGSFVGAFLLAAREIGWQATGLDIGEETAGFCHEQGLRVKQRDIAQAGLEFGSSDGVFVWNTFDQLAEPGKTLGAVRRCLKLGGRLVIRIPNGTFQRAALELLQTKPEWMARITTARAYENFVTFPYLAGYTPDSIAQLFASHAFETTQIEGDTILPLASDQTLPFAVTEERRFKRATMRACRAHEKRTGRLAYPWLDVYATAI